jgi:putative membrane protein
MADPFVPQPTPIVSIVAKGFCMGTADVVPGVSGGTMAFILGIYQRLLAAIRAFDLTALKLVMTGRFAEAVRHVDLVFLLALFGGIALALGVFTRVIPLPRLIVTHSQYIYALFFGLIAASIVVLLRGLAQINGMEWAALLGGAIAGGLIVTLVPTQTPDTSWFVFIAGAIAISAMILPGISGSFILLVLQKYAYIFDAVGRLELSILIPFGLGCMTGLMAFSRVLTWLMAHYYRYTLVAICGILIASMWKIWPFQERTYATARGKERLIDSSPILPTEFGPETGGAIALVLIGFAAVWLLHVYASKRAVAIA